MLLGRVLLALLPRFSRSWAKDMVAEARRVVELSAWLIGVYRCSFCEGGGESTVCIRCSRSHNGLSPRVRGNRVASFELRVIRRTIPACAGEPNRSKWRYSTPSDYPRVCGGTTKWAVHQCLLLDYPRVCGGTQRKMGDLDKIDGLSPRVRGNRDLLSGAAVLQRTIPACAGEPRLTILRLRPQEDYPRVCGGTWRNPDTGAWEVGLSPRVRGNPREALPGTLPPGTIPACAGEPR